MPAGQDESNPFRVPMDSGRVMGVGFSILIGRVTEQLKDKIDGSFEVEIGWVLRINFMDP